MTRKRSSPMGLEIYLPILLAFIMLPLLTQAAPLQDYTEIQQYTEGCYYNYNHYNEGDRIITNEPCLNCTCHNKMLMCYLRVCPFTRPIGNDCIVEKREDQCCPIITCPEVPVDVPHAAPEPGTELSIPEKFGCSIEGQFYLEGAQVPSNPNNPCELCYCIKNRTSCLMQECTLHIEGCTPIYNKGSCCPVRYNCDHENDVLELEDHSTTTEAATTTTTVRPTTGFILSSTMTPAISKVCIHNNEVYADGARVLGETACENCYCMRGDIVCAVQECHMPMLKDNGKLCHPLPAAEGECCPSNYVCEDETATTQIIEGTTQPYSILDEEVKISTVAPVKDLHSAIPEEDLQLQAHIDEEETTTKAAATEEKATEAEIVSKPIATGDQAEKDVEPETTEDQDKKDVEQETTEYPDKQDTEQESTTKNVEHYERPTISPSDVKFIESEEHATAAPTSSDKLFESSTEILGGAKEGEETVTKIPTTADELPEISTESTDIGEEYTTATSASDKPEIEEFVTEVSAIDLESQSTTISTPTEKEISEETTESTDETKVAGGDYTTKAPPSVSEEVDLSEDIDKKKKPVDSDEFVTETYKSTTESSITTKVEYKPVDLATKPPLAVKPTGQTTEEEQAAPIFPLELTTEFSVKPSKDEEEIIDDLSTKSPAINETEESISGKPEEQQVASIEEDVGATTQAPEDVDLSTEEPKEEEKLEDSEKEKQAAVTMTTTVSVEHEQTTESVDKTKPLYSVETSAESDESEIVSKLPISTDKKEPPVTTTSIIEEYTDNISTTSTYIESMTSKIEADNTSEVFPKDKPVLDDKQELYTTSAGPGKFEDQTTVPSAEIKPIFDDELGSGDYTTEATPEAPYEISTVSPTIEVITSISHKQEEESVTAKPLLPTKEKPEQESSSAESSEESAESDEDIKLMDLTTAKPSGLDATALAADSSEEITEEEKETSTKATLEEKPMTTDEDKAEGQIASEDKTESTAMVTSLDEKLPTEGIIEHKDKLLGESEISSTPSSADESVKSGPSSEGNKEQETTEKSTELEYTTSQKTVEEQEQQTSAAPTVGMITEEEEEEDDQKVLPESDDHKVEEQTIITDSPMLIIEDISAFTAKPTSQADRTTEHSGKPEEEEKVESTAIQEPLLDVKEGFKEQAPTTTIKPFVEPSRAEEIPDMQLPSDIPGEGDCLAGQKTYKNNTLVPTSDECEVACRCASSIVICERVKCDVPENIEKCILDEAATNKCCPTYICSTEALPPRGEVSAEAIEEDEYEKVQFATTPSKISTEKTSEETDANKTKVTTMKPSYDAVSIPEIEMPIAITEEPMSHVKDEDDLEKQTTKAPIKTVAEEKKEVLIEDHSPTIPADVAEEIIVPQSMAPIEMSKDEEQEIVTEKTSIHTPEKEAVPEVSVSQEQEEEIVTEKISVKTPEKEAVPELSISQKQPETEFEEKTTSPHVLEESATGSTMKVGSDKHEDEIYTTTIAPTALKPLEEGESEEEKTEFGPQTSIPTTLGGETPYKSSEEPELVPFESTTETIKEPETQTDRKISHDTTEKPSIAVPTVSYGDKEEVQKPESQTMQSIISDELSTLAPSVDEIYKEITTSDEVQKGIETSSTAPGSETRFPTITTEYEEKQPSTGVYSKDISDSTTTTAPSKVHDAETYIIHTTVLPSKVDFEKEYSITKQPSDKIKDVDIPSETLDKKLDSISTTIASITEEAFDDLSTVSDIDHVSWEEEHKDDKETVEPTEKGIIEKEIESSSVVYQTGDEASVEHATIAEDKTLEHTVSPIIIDEQKETTEEYIVSSFAPEMPISGSTEPNQPETQTHIAFIEDHTVSQTSEESHTTSFPIFDEKISVHTESTDIVTEKSIDLETKTDSSSLSPSSVLYTESPSHNITEEISTTIASESDEEQAVDSSTDSSVEQQTQPTEEVEPEEITEKATESTKEENMTIPTVEHIKEDVEVSMAHTVAPTDRLTKQEGVDYSTIGPITFDEYTTASILSEEDVDTFKKDEIISESGLTTAAPSMDTEIPTAHAPVKQPSLDLFEEASGESVESEEEVSTTPSSIYHIGEFVTQRVEEQEMEGSGEEVEETDKMEAVTKQHSETSITTEQIEISTLVSSADSESVTKAAVSSEDTSGQTTDKDIISSVTKAPLFEQNTEVQPEEDITPSAEKEMFDVSSEQPKKEELLVSTQSITLSDVVPDKIPESEIKEYVTETPMATAQQYEKDDTTVPPASKDVTYKSPISADEVETVTVLPEGSITEVKSTDETVDSTEQPEEHDGVQNVTTKYPIDFEDTEVVTVKQREEEENISAVTRYPVPSADIDYATEQILGESEEPKDSETTAKFPTSEIYDFTTSHIPTDEVEQTKVKVSEEDIEISTAKEPEHFDAESIDMTTPQPSKDSEDTLDITKIPEALEVETTTAKLLVGGDEISELDVTQEPIIELQEENIGADKTADHTTTKVPTALQHDDSQYVTELPPSESHSEKESHENITEIPAIDEVTTVKLPDIEEQATELPIKGTESEKDESQEMTTKIAVTAKVSTEKLSEQITELPTKGIKSDEEYFVETTELPVGTHVPSEHLPEVSEQVTELLTTTAETEKEVAHEISTDSYESFDKLPALPPKHIESDEVTTELPVVTDVSTAKPQEKDSQLPNNTIHPNGLFIGLQTTRLPGDAHVYKDNLTEHVTELPYKDIESHETSTALPVDTDISTEESLGHVTELPTEYHEEDAEAHMITDEKEHITEMPEDVHISSEKLPEHVTDLPTKNVEAEGEIHEITDKLPEHITESPYKDIESEEDVYEESTTKLSELPSKHVESEAEDSHEKSTELPVETDQVSTSGQAVEQTTEHASYAEETSKRTSIEAAEDISAVKLHSATTLHPLFSHHTTSPSGAIDSRIDDTSSQSTLVPTKDEEIFTTSTTTTVSTTTSEPVTTSTPHYQPQPPVYGQPPQYGPTQYEDEYTDEDEGEVFGPGTCRYGGKLYVSAQQIPRDDPCDFCFCFRSDIICLQQSCPPPISGCHEEPISGFCCPRYECPVSMATVLNITTSTTTTSTTLPPHFLHHSYGNNVQRNGCLINGRSYRVGEKIESTSGPCINCACGGDGKMKCDPQACVPEPTMQQVMAVVAAGRKR